MGAEIAETLELKLQLDSLECRLECAEAARRSAEERLQEVTITNTEDIRNFRLSMSSTSASALQAPTSFGEGSHVGTEPHSLFQELYGVVCETALQRAEGREAELTMEMKEAGSALEQRSEVSESTAAKDAAIVQRRLRDMRKGTWFEKVAFRTDKLQARFVRLSGDLSRVEWAKAETGPFSAVST